MRRRDATELETVTVDAAVRSFLRQDPEAELSKYKRTEYYLRSMNILYNYYTVQNNTSQ